MAGTKCASCNHIRSQHNGKRSKLQPNHCKVCSCREFLNSRYTKVKTGLTADKLIIDEFELENHGSNLIGNPL